MTDETTPEPLTIAEVFRDHRRYRVPIYQRAYAWTPAEVTTLLADVRQARLLADHPAEREQWAQTDYYLGSLVVHRVRDDEGNELDEVVDGQQRLTTLTILLSVAPRILSGELDAQKLAVLDYEGRPEAAQDLMTLRRTGHTEATPYRVSAVAQAAEVMAAACVASTADSAAAESQDTVFSQEDLDYLLHHVRLLRTQLPAGTDLNHYFEVMNTRGEQLEKHEILKARLLQALADPVDRRVFAHVWDACAVMDRHVQLQFTPSPRASNPRDKIFGSAWSDVFTGDFTSLRAALALESGESPAAVPATLGHLLSTVEEPPATDGTGGGRIDDEDDGSYGTIVDFPNFLLHVLRVMRERHNPEDGMAPRWGAQSHGEVRLEDKFLLQEFESARVDESWSKEFIVLLLQMRHLLDSYVIRTVATSGTQADEENWVLRQAQKYQSGVRVQLTARNTFEDSSTQDAVRNLQAMFQVTDTRRTSKYFLYRILRWLVAQTHGVEGPVFRAMLEDLARERLASYDLTAVWNEGVNVPNFVFNVLDYVLWSAGTDPSSDRATAVVAELSDPEKKTLDARASSFRFRYRTSVEHFYPVVPGEGQTALSTQDVNRFGNLCIMGRAENSQRNNLMPVSKVQQYTSEEQSLKFQLMAAVLKEAQRWEVREIMAHGHRAQRVLETWRDRHRDS